MCRNIKTLFNFDPPATHAEIHDAALQFVRKLSGTTKPSRTNEAAFEQAVAAPAELAKAEAEWQKRLEQLPGKQRLPRGVARQALV